MKEIFFKLTQKELLKKLPLYLEHNGYTNNNIIITADYIYAKGDIPILLVAHLDTVFTTTPKLIITDQEKNIMTSPTGLGADDRAGVFALLEISKNCKPYLLFTTDEEIGCIGARVAALEITDIDVKYVIGLDRKGKNDAVFYDCLNNDFINYITSFGFKENYGTISDIAEICPAWDVAGVNLSIGYYNAHSKTEYLKIDELMNTIEKVKIMLKNLPDEKFYFFTNEKESNLYYLFEDERWQ